MRPDDGAPAADGLDQALGGQLGDGPPHGIASGSMRGHQFGLLRDGGAGRVIAAGDARAQRLSDVLPQNHGRASLSPLVPIHPDVLTVHPSWRTLDTYGSIH